MKKFIKIIFLVLIIFIIIVMNSTVVFSTNISEENKNDINNNSLNNTNESKKEKTLEDLNKEKDELKSNLEQSNSQIQLVESELSDLLLKVQEISLEILEKNTEIDKLTLENKELDRYIYNVEKDLKKITSDYNKKQNALDQNLVATYETGKISYLELLLKSKSLINFISNYYLITEIIEADKLLVEEVSTAKSYMETLDTTLQEKKKKLEENKSIIQKNKISLENMQALKNKKVLELSEIELNLHNQIETYQNEIENIEKEIRLLAISNIDSQYIGGKMAWPVPGYTRITSQFGMRTHPITGVYKLHTGTDIGAPMGATFIAANDGVVVKAGYNGAYGNMVIIDHGGGVTTLYAHGSEILVQVGQVVEQGNPVLKVGSTGYSTGPHAHFEVRVNGEYKNPLDYITSQDSKENEKEIVILN